MSCIYILEINLLLVAWFANICSQSVGYLFVLCMVFHCCAKAFQGGFPGGAVVENVPANAGDTGSSPGLGRSHMPRSGWAHEPQLLSLRVWSLCSATRGHDSERAAHRDEEWPPLAATRGSPRTETKTQHSQKINK